MLIEVHYGNARVLLANGNCRAVHLLDYIRTQCSLSESIKFDLCLLSNGEPFRLSSFDSEFVSSKYERIRSCPHVRCVLTQIDDEGTYIPLLNDSKLLTSDFLLKLSRATNPKLSSSMTLKQGKQSPNALDEDRKRRPSLKSLAMAARVMKKK